ncbi:MAG: hypothetical protein LBK45_01345 [Tannerellaceae bacterium]|jgi:hypothetical protein|nr:hypothetical protein [Tannerellaceae bacterium]
MKQPLWITDSTEKATDIDNMQFFLNRKVWRTTLIAVFIVGISIAGIVIGRTRNRVQIEFDIHIDKEAIYLSMYAEPPQFAIWLENPVNGKTKQVFVTNRAGQGDWEGKADVPVAIPYWSTVFKNREEDNIYDGVSGATPKEDYFRVRVEVPPGSEWICWIEMNLAGDYNNFYPQFNPVTFQEDEFSCGQPALLYRTEIKAEKGSRYVPERIFMSLWENGENRLLSLDSTITTAQCVFDKISIQAISPKPVLIDLNTIEKQEVLKKE